MRYTEQLYDQNNADLQAITLSLSPPTHTHSSVGIVMLQVRFRFPSRGREIPFRRFDQTGFVFHPVLQEMGTTDCFPRGKAIAACS
jgi:hypothetical protein